MYILIHWVLSSWVFYNPRLQFLKIAFTCTGQVPWFSVSSQIFVGVFQFCSKQGNWHFLDRRSLGYNILESFPIFYGFFFISVQGALGSSSFEVSTFSISELCQAMLYLILKHGILLQLTPERHSLEFSSTQSMKYKKNLIESEAFLFKFKKW